MIDVKAVKLMVAFLRSLLSPLRGWICRDFRILGLAPQATCFRPSGAKSVKLFALGCIGLIDKTDSPLKHTGDLNFVTDRVLPD